jgi:tripartite-type tricarboxylate transporter receptor subunit TctC
MLRLSDFLGGTIMKLRRRTFLRLAAGAAALPVVPHIAWAQAYPSRPVHIIVGFPAGGGADIAARIIGQYLSERLGQSFIVENRPGAASNIAIEAAVHAAPDGYTLLLVPSNAPMDAALYEKSNVSVARDMSAVAGFSRQPLIMVVNPSFSAKSVPEFIAYAKANPGQINMASGGIGSTQHLAGVLFQSMTGVRLNHVPYRGSAPAVTDLLGGQVHVLFDLLNVSIGHVRAGKLRALGVTTAKRSAALPDVPAIGDFVAGYEVSAWTGIAAPRNTPPDIVEKLNKEINSGLADPRLRARLAEFGSTTFAQSPTEFGRFLSAETEKWAKVIRAAGINAE